MNTEIAVIETAEGCQSCAIATQDFVIRAWLENQEPDVVGGTIEAVSYKAGAALRGRDRVAFMFHDSRAALVSLARGCTPESVLADPRFEFADAEAVLGV